jgi:hypothetical protein
MEGIIKNYLSGARLYMEGVTIYEKFGNNVALKRAFRINPENRILRMTLFEELRRLAGLTEAEFNNLSRNVKPSTGLKNTDEHTLVTTRNNRTINPGEAKKIRFRERFTFLNTTDCPDVLKVLVNDMFASYDAYRTAHNALAFMPPDAPMKETSLLAETAVEEMLNDRMIWTELQHYQEHKTLLGNHPDVKDYLKWIEYREMSDFDLMQRRKNAASNISKCKVKIEEDTSEEDRLKHEASMREWITVKQICDHEIEHRKKGK